MTGLDWMTDAACVGSGLPWTADPRTSHALIAAMRATCAACPALLACDGYAGEHATAGFWAGTWRTLPGDRPTGHRQDPLPLNTEDGAAA